MTLSRSDLGVDEHLFLFEMHDHGTRYDQHNLLDLALGDTISRRLQLWEERYAEKLRASTAGGVSAGHASERHLFLSALEVVGFAIGRRSGDPQGAKNRT